MNRKHRHLDIPRSNILVGKRLGPFSPWGEGARRADEGAFLQRAESEVPPHQFGQMTYCRAFEVASVSHAAYAAVSHGLTSSPQWGEGARSPTVGASDLPSAVRLR
jgi:hypothetical protein